MFYESTYVSKNQNRGYLHFHIKIIFLENQSWEHVRLDIKSVLSRISGKTNKELLILIYSLSLYLCLYKKNCRTIVKQWKNLYNSFELTKTYVIEQLANLLL